jgi:hypothetical protein
MYSNIHHFLMVNHSDPESISHQNLWQLFTCDLVPIDQPFPAFPHLLSRASWTFNFYNILFWFHIWVISCTTFFFCAWFISLNIKVSGSLEPILSQKTGFNYSLCLNDVLLHTIFSLPMHLLKDTYNAFIYWLVWIVNGNTNVSVTH